jgi:ParB-like chromosome segregation protein Spo0J
MKIRLVPIDQVTPYEANPRNNDPAVAAVAASLQEFGFRKPIVVDAQRVIVAGHTCFRAAQQLGLKKVPIHVALDLTPDQVRAYRIADNKTGELAEWDFGLLKIELAELQDADYSIDGLGFSADDLAKIFQTDIAEGLVDPDDIPAPPDAAITQPGDLWILGEHRLLCGDSSLAPAPPSKRRSRLGRCKSYLRGSAPPIVIDSTSAAL